jgi:hypothetical protein
MREIPRLLSVSIMFTLISAVALLIVPGMLTWWVIAQIVNADGRDFGRQRYVGRWHFLRFGPAAPLLSLIALFCGAAPVVINQFSAVSISVLFAGVALGVFSLLAFLMSMILWTYASDPAETARGREPRRSADTMEEQRTTQREARAAIVGYGVGLTVLIVSFAASSIGFLNNNLPGTPALILLLTGALIAFVSSFFVWTTRIGQTTRFVAGALAAGVGACALAFWPFVLSIWILPDGDERRSACWGPLVDAGVQGGVGQTVEISTTLLPAQIHCGIGASPSVRALPGLESMTLSAVVIALACLVIVGVCLMIPRRTVD